MSVYIYAPEKVEKRGLRVGEVLMLMDDPEEELSKGIKKTNVMRSHTICVTRYEP